MQQIVINAIYGGYSLSKEAYEFLGLPWDDYGHAYEDDRTNPALIKCVKTLKKKADGRCARLKIVRVPDDVKWTIEDYDGLEWVAEVHRIWSQYIKIFGLLWNP